MAKRVLARTAPTTPMSVMRQIMTRRKERKREKSVHVLPGTAQNLHWGRTRFSKRLLNRRQRVCSDTLLEFARDDLHWNDNGVAFLARLPLTEWRARTVYLHRNRKNRRGAPYVGGVDWSYIVDIIKFSLSLSICETIDVSVGTARTIHDTGAHYSWTLSRWTGL